MALLWNQRPQSRHKVGVYVMTRPDGSTTTFGVLSETFLGMSERDAAGVRALDRGGVYASKAHGWIVRRKS
jgi:hypothetical protein